MLISRMLIWRLLICRMLILEMMGLPFWGDRCSKSLQISKVGMGGVSAGIGG